MKLEKASWRWASKYAWRQFKTRAMENQFFRLGLFTFSATIIPERRMVKVRCNELREEKNFRF